MELIKSFCYREQRHCTMPTLHNGHGVPSVDMVWSSDPLFRVQPIASVMTVKRFKKMLQGLHVNDNSQMPARDSVTYDRLYKLRP